MKAHQTGNYFIGDQMYLQGERNYSCAKKTSTTVYFSIKMNVNLKRWTMIISFFFLQ